jgi:hypothetical protein
MDDCHFNYFKIIIIIIIIINAHRHTQSGFVSRREGSGEEMAIVAVASFWRPRFEADAQHG